MLNIHFITTTPASSFFYRYTFKYMPIVPQWTYKLKFIFYSKNYQTWDEAIFMFFDKISNL